MSEVLQVLREGEVRTLVLNRPDKRNALSAELVEQLLDAIAQAQQDRVQLLVLRGEGRCFSAGFDFSDVEQQSEGDLLLRFTRIEMLLQAVATLPCLTLALAQGKNFGAGVDLFAACRRRIATGDASFRMPGLKFGLVLGSRRFADIVGKAQAAQILEEARSFTAAEALAMGFAQHLAEPEAWPTATAAAQTSAAALEPWSRAALYDALAENHADADLARLVRSAARPGLKQRIARYLSGA